MLMKKQEWFRLLRRLPALAVIFVAAFLMLLPCPSWAEPATPAQEDDNQPRLRSLALANEIWLGDFDQLLEKRVIRVLVPQSRTLYLIVRGKEQGLIGDMVREFERYINKKYLQILRGLQADDQQHGGKTKNPPAGRCGSIPQTMTDPPQHRMEQTASPARAVSLYLSDISRPVSSIASTTASKSIFWRAGSPADARR